MRRRPGFVTALLLIGLGVVLLLDNLGLVHIDLRALLPLWPVLLILFAIEMLVSRTRSNVAYGIGVAWAVVVIVAAVVLAWNATKMAPSATEAVAEGPQETITVPLDGATSASVRVQLGSGSSWLGSSVNPSSLVSGTLTGEGAALEVERRNEAGHAIVTLHSVQSDNPVIQRMSQLGGSSAWQLALSQGVPLTVALGQSTGKAEIDLSDLVISTFDLAFGIADVEVLLPHSDTAETRIVGTAGSLLVELPSGVPARIHVSPRLNSVDVGPGYEALSIGYQTAGLVSAQSYQVVHIELGAGRIRLR